MILFFVLRFINLNSFHEKYYRVYKEHILYTNDGTTLMTYHVNGDTIYR